MKINFDQLFKEDSPPAFDHKILNRSLAFEEDKHSDPLNISNAHTQDFTPLTQRTLSL